MLCIISSFAVNSCVLLAMGSCMGNTGVQQSMTLVQSAYSRILKLTPGQCLLFP